jgi:hypothetical protein
VEDLDLVSRWTACENGGYGRGCGV